MIECTSKNGVKVYVTRTYDVEPNIGGFYCEVYLDENCDHKVDDFCISADVVNLDLDELYMEKHIRDTVITELPADTLKRVCEHIDWEERKYEIALHAMQAIISNSHDRDYRTESYSTTYKDSPSEIAYRAAAYADALIQMLKQEEKNK